MTSQKTNDWTPVTSFTLKRLKPTRVKSDAEWKTVSINDDLPKKRTIRKPRWTIKKTNQEQI
jgi:hypothetical protein